MQVYSSYHDKTLYQDKNIINTPIFMLKEMLSNVIAMM